MRAFFSTALTDPPSAFFCDKVSSLQELTLVYTIYRSVSKYEDRLDKTLIFIQSLYLWTVAIFTGITVINHVRWWQVEGVKAKLKLLAGTIICGVEKWRFFCLL